MKFVLTFSIKAGASHRDEAISRFLKTGGIPPIGAKLVGRWTKVDFSGGFVLLESGDPQALTQFALTWSDVIDLAIVPVSDDQELAQVLQKHTAKAAAGV